jgi:hypothetical protein
MQLFLWNYFRSKKSDNPKKIPPQTEVVFFLFPRPNDQSKKIKSLSEKSNISETDACFIISSIPF